ncbi:MAG: hypothetical protein K2Q28_13530 [Hyphomicrobium sp.]|nr:hypothetical protein [Hyphomicrobium sp.]
MKAYIIASSILALVSLGASAANADPLLADLAKSGSIITTGGILTK